MFATRWANTRAKMQPGMLPGPHVLGQKVSHRWSIDQQHVNKKTMLVTCSYISNGRI